jgi:hypothetical protein
MYSEKNDVQCFSLPDFVGPLWGIRMSQRHPFSTVSCFRRFVSRDKFSHYFDRLICQRLYYDAEIMGDVVTLLYVHFNFIIQFRNMFLFLKSSPLHIMSNLCCVYWVLLCFVFFNDMHYNTMIRVHFRRSPVFGGLFHVINFLIILIA